MGQANSRPHIAHPAHTFAAQTFIQPNDLVSRARTWAADEVGAAIAHQINEPLTALLLYLHDIKERGERSTSTEALPASMRDMVDRALHETERVCDIMERLGHTSQPAPLDADTAVARGREAIDSWARNGREPKPPAFPALAPPLPILHRLTPREREALALITGGSSNKEGGRRMGISTRTFEVHRAHIMEKVGARNAADLVRIALSEAR